VYKKARAGQIPEFTGITSPYEVPDHPDLAVETANHSLEKSVGQVIQYLKVHSKLPKGF